MSVSIFPAPSDRNRIHDLPHSTRTLSAVALASCDILSVVPELSSRASSNACSGTDSAPVNHPTSGEILQMIRDSAYEILDSSGGRSPSPTTSALGDVADDQLQIQNISRISDDIVRNLARLAALRNEAGNDDHDDNPNCPHGLDAEMEEVKTEPSIPLIMPSPGVLRSQRHSFKSKGARSVCRDCHSIVTPKWRPGPHGPATLCNVCGLLYAKRMGIIDGLHDG